MKEQERKFERIEHLNVEGEDQGKVLIDLSTAGAAFLHTLEIKAESKILLRIRDLSIDAIAIYCHKRAGDVYRIGIRFRNVSPELQKRLQTMVDDFSRGMTLSYTFMLNDVPEKKV